MSTAEVNMSKKPVAWEYMRAKEGIRLWISLHVICDKKWFDTCYTLHLTSLYLYTFFFLPPRRKRHQSTLSPQLDSSPMTQGVFTDTNILYQLLSSSPLWLHIFLRLCWLLSLVSLKSQYNSRAIWPIPSDLWLHNSQSRILKVFSCLLPILGQ